MPSLLTAADYKGVFERMAGLCLILDPALKIVAQNDAHARATMTRREDTLGKFLFEVFPDNPAHSAANGVSILRQSLLNVLKTRAIDIIPNFQFDISPVEGGRYVPRYWRVVNTPVLDEEGFVRLIINQVDDLTVVLE
jgi:PAS domain-containing protein